MNYFFQIKSIFRNIYFQKIQEIAVNIAIYLKKVLANLRLNIFIKFIMKLSKSYNFIIQFNIEVLSL